MGRPVLQAIGVPPHTGMQDAFSVLWVCAGTGAAGAAGLAVGGCAYAAMWPGSRIFGAALIAPRRPHHELDRHSNCPLRLEAGVGPSGLGAEEAFAPHAIRGASTGHGLTDEES